MACRLLVSNGMQELLRPVFRARDLHRKFGLRVTIGLALKKLISPVARVGSVYLMECDLRAGLPAVEPVQGIIAREAFVEDIDPAAPANSESSVDSTSNAGTYNLNYLKFQTSEWKSEILVLELCHESDME